MVTLDSVAATGLNMGAEGSKASSDPLLNLSTLIHTSSGGHFFFFFCSSFLRQYYLYFIRVNR